MAKKPAATTPTKLTDIEAYRDCQERLSQLTRQRNDVQTKCDNLEAELAQHDPRASIDDAATALLAGGDTATLVDLAQLREEHREAERELRVVSRAVEMQSQALQEAQRKACREICAAWKPRHEEIAKRVANALEALESALGEARAFRHELEDNGVDFRSPLASLDFKHLEDSWHIDETNQFDIWRRDLREAGYPV